MIRLIAFCVGVVFSLVGAGQIWSAMDSLPGPARHHPVTFSLGKFGYVLTGSTTTGVTNDFYRYDSDSNSWTRLEDFPGEGRSYSYGVTSDSVAYLGFGSGTTFLNDLWRFDPSTSKWSQLKSCDCTPRMHPALVYLNGKIYVGLGAGPTGSFPPYSDLNDWWEYDIKSNKWSRKADFIGEKRHHPYYFTIKNKVYVGFGHGEIVYNDIYSYDPLADKWERLNYFDAGSRVAGTQFSFNGKGYVLSGQNGHHRHMEFGEFWEYSPEDDSWKELTPHPGKSRWAPGSFVIDSTLYLIGGGLEDFQHNVTYLNDVWKYDLRELTKADSFSNSAELYVEVDVESKRIRVIGNNKKEVLFSSIELFDMQGASVLKYRNLGSNSWIPIQPLASGIYILRVQHEGQFKVFKLLTY